jgi:CheY-like chemotaxis protein
MPPAFHAPEEGHYGVGNGAMAKILAADYGRDDFLALGSPLVSTLRAWGYEVVEAENSLDVLQQASRAQPDAVVLYDTLPAMEALRTALHQHVATQGIPILILHEQVQRMQFTDMVVVDPQYRLGKSPRQFDVHELRRLLDQVFA